MDYKSTLPLHRMPLVFKGFKFMECTKELLIDEFREILYQLVSRNSELKELKVKHLELQGEVKWATEHLKQFYTQTRPCMLEGIQFTVKELERINNKA